MSVKRSLALITLAAIICIVASTAIAQVYVVGANGTVQAQEFGQPRVTWVHVETAYQSGGEVEYRHYIIRADQIVGVGGPFRWWLNGVGVNRMSLYTNDDKFPMFHLPDLGTVEDNLMWADAIERVVRENPGGIVELIEYLP